MTIPVLLVNVTMPIPGVILALREELAGNERSHVLETLVESGRIEPGRLSITLDPSALAGRLTIEAHQLDPDALTKSDAFTLRRRGVEARLVLENEPSAVDPVLLKSIAQGRAWFDEIRAGASMQLIAQREGVDQRRVAHLVDLAFLATDIVQAIVEGRHPVALTADKLIRARHRPLWSDQRGWIAGL